MPQSQASHFLPETWHDAQGKPITCEDKKRELHAVWSEAYQACQDALDDTVLMGCASVEAAAALQRMADSLQPTVRQRNENEVAE